MAAETNPEQASKQANTRANTQSASKQASKEISKQGNKQTNQQTNKQTGTSTRLAWLGLGLQSKCNHACECNAETRAFVFSDGTVDVVATRPIARDDEAPRARCSPPEPFG